MAENCAEKYDRLADGFAERSWANLHYDMVRRRNLTTHWGRPLQRGDSVLELGCGDGYLAELLLRQGLRYRGVDIAPKMVARSKLRIAQAGFEASIVSSDANHLSLNDPVDGVISYMGSFFSFIDDPLALLKRFRPYVRAKIILDLNPRGPLNVNSAIEILRAAGFEKITWRPYFVPMSVKLPTAILSMLTICEDFEPVRSLPLRWKCNTLIKGECGATSIE